MTKVVIVNKTPHDIHIIEDGVVIRTYPRDEEPVRLSMETIEGEPLPDGTPTSYTIFGKIEGLPDPQEGVMYIVSQMVQSTEQERNQRKDILVPSRVVRDEKGNIIGCMALGR